MLVRVSTGKPPIGVAMGLALDLPAGSDGSYSAVCR